MLAPGEGNAKWLNGTTLSELLADEAVPQERGSFGQPWRVDMMLARQNRRAAAPRFVTCWVMRTIEMNECPNPNDVVALLATMPVAKLLCGQAGTVVETLQQGKLLLKYADDEGGVYAIKPNETAELLVLQYESEAA